MYEWFSTALDFSGNKSEEGSHVSAQPKNVITTKQPKVFCTKALVIGGGPSGISAALTLNALECEHILVDDRHGNFKVGESLPPDCKPILVSLGVPLSLLDKNHFMSCGNVSYWGSTKPGYNDFIKNPYGNGWLLDRCLFEESLLKHAEIKGSKVWTKTRVDKIEREPNADWKVTLAGSGNIVRCKWIVDASGRPGRIAKQLSAGIAKKKAFDRLVAFIAHFEGDGEVSDQQRLTFVEAVATGWFYSVRVPTSRGSTRVVVFHTDDDLPQAKTARTAKGFLELLHTTTALKKYLADCKYNLENIKRPKCTSANSSVLNLYGNVDTHWLVVGDAACSFDPLSSQGMMTSLMSGVACANALARIDKAKNSSEKNSHLQYYGDGLDSIFARFLALKKQFYGMEERWTQEEFWNRRSANLTSTSL